MQKRWQRELKWDKSSEGAIEQIKKKKYVKALEDYKESLLLLSGSIVHLAVKNEIYKGGYS